ncbi:acetyl-CoA carboxylase carboxyl transferase subunit beta [Lactobacillus helveticus]|uniref:acetyl-CoA carboxylase carboxyltransferase subunit beta n=1 Tax=Lactobacillus helveticus TaxID=1587 RepID=UPI0021823E58|nr:acetyl-CoA carboxylase carboxyltransferase subunit beta [Lactobacillus helveticus]MCT0164869.1 acetyl-CoA carboxylase carboxyl transferase subunit beta [Lactobacillus helveticus]MCT0193213.1 acetyl-CoA carboxylase carboxyl transferase subunit beta [Lactobacillus helveticus]MCT0197961.1 acetyl-CoA carboxylase carboxyl transferase subunit beta [Lactobacillus helveticus]
MLQSRFEMPSHDELVKRMDAIPDHVLRECPICHAKFLSMRLGRDHTCPKCGYGFRILAKRRVKITFDKFTEIDQNITVPDRYTDEKYRAKIAKAKKVTGLNESVLTGIGSLNKQQVAVGIMDPFWIMGSLGSATGEKITRLFELSTRKDLPVVMFTSSGGARMQEGIHSLMQMAKVSSAVAEHSAAGLLYIVVLCDPTTGGVTASFAMDGDIILAEPHALVGFAGRRVIEQTIMQTPPKDFQSAETVMKHGFIDQIVKRSDMKKTLTQLLRLHTKENAYG